MTTRAAAETDRRASRGTVLIVDDEPVNGLVLARMAELLGFRAVTVTNGAEAVNAIEAAEYVAVLMDMQMPVMDGLEATQRIRAAEGDRRYTPIVAVSASVFPDDREQCLQAGMDDFVPKPVMSGVLAKTLDRWVGPQETDVDVVEHPITAPPIDESRAAELQATLGDEYFEVLALFCAATAERVDAIDVAVDEGDAVELRRLAHSVTGSARTFGCEAVAEASHLLYLSLSSDDRTRWADAAWRLRTTYNELHDLLKSQFDAAGVDLH